MYLPHVHGNFGTRNPPPRSEHPTGRLQHEQKCRRCLTTKQQRGCAKGQLSVVPGMSNSLSSASASASRISRVTLMVNGGGCTQRVFGSQDAQLKVGAANVWLVMLVWVLDISQHLCMQGNPQWWLSHRCGHGSPQTSVACTACAYLYALESRPHLRDTSAAPSANPTENSASSSRLCTESAPRGVTGLCSGLQRPWPTRAGGVCNIWLVRHACTTAPLADAPHTTQLVYPCPLPRAETN